MSDKDSGQTKVLRIGVVQRSAIIEERELDPQEGASLGSSEAASFTAVAEGLPDRLELFSHDAKGYRLHLHPGLEGRIQLDGSKVEDFKALRAGGKIEGEGGAEYIRLWPASRGKVTIAGVTVLFQFRNRTLVGPAPLIEDDGEPVALPPGINVPFWQDIDTQFAAILLIVALCQVSFIAYVRSLTFVQSTSIDQIAPQYQRLIMPDRFMPKPEEPKLAEAGNTKAEEAKPAKKKPKTKKPSPGKKGGGQASAKAKKAALAKKVAGKGLLKVLGAKGGAGGAIADVFSEGSGEGGDLGDAFSGIQGVDIATEGGQTGSRGGGSGEGVGIGDLKTGGGGSLKRGQKTETLVRGSAQTGAPDVDGELSQAQINRVVKRQLKSLRDCYERALKRNRKLAGKVVINFEILETGRTSSIDVDDRMGSSVVRSCISGRVKYWRFPRPKGGSVFVSYPVVFTPAG